MNHDEAAKAVDILRPGVVIPVLDHDFSRSVAHLILTTTGSAEAFAALVAETTPDVTVAAAPARRPVDPDRGHPASSVCA